MRDPKVEQVLNRRKYAYRYEEEFPLHSIATDGNPARWMRAKDEHRVTAIGIAILDGDVMPAIVLCETHAPKAQMLSGRHRTWGTKEAGKSTIAAYVITDVLDDYEREELPILLNAKEGVAPTYSMKLEQAAYLATRWPERDRKAMAVDLGLKQREIDTFLQLIAATERAEKLLVVNEFRKLHDDGLRIAVNTLRLDPVFERAVKALSFTNMQGRAAKGLIQDVNTCKSENAALERLRCVEEQHKEELQRMARQHRKRRLPTLAQRYGSRLRSARAIFPEVIEKLALSSHGQEFVADFNETAKDVRAQLNEVIELCATLLSQWQKKGQGQSTGAQSSVGSSAPN